MRHRRGQAAVEWLALMSVCTAAAIALMGPLRDAVASARLSAPPAAVAPGPAIPVLRAAPLPDGDGARVVAIANDLLALGIVEEPPGSNRSPAILQFTDGNAEAWCADFVSWVLRAAGMPFTGGASGGWRLAWTGDVRAWFALRGRYRERLVADPQPGDIIWFRRGHVGIVVRADARTVETIEGNAGDAVRARTYTAWRGNTDIDGFGRPG